MNDKNNISDGDLNVDPVYKLGFEHGYWLSRGNSKELDNILQQNSNPDYGAGLQAGKREAGREKVRDRFKNTETRFRDTNKGNKSNKDMDRD